MLIIHNPEKGNKIVLAKIYPHATTIEDVQRDPFQDRISVVNVPEEHHEGYYGYVKHVIIGGDYATRETIAHYQRLIAALEAGLAMTEEK